MTAHAARICLITPSHVASAPRVVKEADALAAAGYITHVVSGRTFRPADGLDATLFGTARWQSTVVDCLDRSGSMVRRLIRRSARLAIGRGSRSLALAARAQNADTARFVAAAAGIQADLYIGHSLAGLAAAAFAGRSRNSRYGFDAEDFHDAETEDALVNPGERRVAHILQRALLPDCTHLTAASPLIGEQYRQDYGVNPVTVLNAFPRRDAPAQPVALEPINENRPARFYWFSQTIGPGRGLEAIIKTIAEMKTPAELQLRGFPAAGYEREMQALARQTGMKRPIVFLPPAAPTEMARLAATADLGLSLEQSQPLNRDLCLTNKVFVYLLAGIPQLMTPTRAQWSLAADLGAAALLLDPSDAAATAASLDAFFSDSSRVAAARQTAWTLARERFCWDVEQATFLRSIENALSQAVGT